MEDVIKKFNLPKYLKGKSFADASKIINKKFEGRSDTDSMETKKELMKRLRDAQDYVKELQEFKSRDQNPGSAETPAVSTNPAPTPNVNMNFLGGILGQLGGESGAEVAGQAAGEAGAGKVMPGIGALSGAVDMIGNSKGKNVDTSGATSAGYVSEEGAALSGAIKGLEAGKDLGPWGMAGGAVLGGITSLAGADKTNNKTVEANKNNTYKNASIYNNLFAKGGLLDFTGDEDEKGADDPPTGIKGMGQRLKDNTNNAMNNIRGDRTVNYGDLDPSYFDVKDRGIDMVISPSANNPQNAQGFKKQWIALQKQNPNLRMESGYEQFQNRNAYGGKMNSYFDGGPLRRLMDPGFNKMVDRIERDKENANIRSYIDTDAIDSAFENLGVNDNASVYGADPIENSTLDPSDFGGGVDRTGKTKAGNFIKDFLGKGGPGQILRYAPSAMNFAQLASLKKPDEEGLERSNRKFEKTPVDEQGIINRVTDSVAGNREAIVGSSGGSGATARKNLLANNLTGTKAISSAMQNAENTNRGENRFAQQFDAQIDRLNVGQANRQNEINARNKGNYDTQKSKLLAALGNDFGNIGREELFKKYPELMGAQYSWLGEFLKEKQSV